MESKKSHYYDEFPEDGYIKSVELIIDDETLNPETLKVKTEIGETCYDIDFFPPKRRYTSMEKTWKKSHQKVRT